jgi:hypothetical protein
MTYKYTKLVINGCYGGFSLSREARTRMQELGYTFDYLKVVKRDDPVLVQVVEELGEKCNRKHSFLEIEIIPEKFARDNLDDECYWKINWDDGSESIELLEDKLRADELQRYMDPILKATRDEVSDEALGAVTRTALASFLIDSYI